MAAAGRGDSTSKFYIQWLQIETPFILLSSYLYGFISVHSSVSMHSFYTGQALTDFGYFERVLVMPKNFDENPSIMN